MNTLKDLADHCYQHWLTTGETQLPSGAIEWIRNELDEQKLSDEVRRIFIARIHGSEKCYRFLKLMGVIERDRLRRLLKKQVLDEIEVERAQRLREIEAQFHEKVNEQRQRVLKRPSEGAMPFWLLMIGAALVSAVLGGMVYASIGWSFGALVGGGVTCGYRLIRTSGLVGQFVSSAQQGLADKRNAVEVDIEDRKGHIDDATIKLELLYNGPLIDTLVEDLGQSLIVSAPNTMRYLIWPAAVTLVLMLLPAFVSAISLFQKIGSGNNPNQAFTQYDSSSIKDVDFLNFTYPSSLCSKQIAGIGTLVKVSKGEFQSDKVYFGLANNNVLYGDINGDGRDEAIVHVACGEFTANFGYSEIFIYAIKDGQAKLLAELNDEGMGRDLALYYPKGDIWRITDNGVKVRNGNLSIARFEGGSHAAPEYIVTLNYHLNGTSLTLSGKPERENAKF